MAKMYDSTNNNTVFMCPMLNNKQSSVWAKAPGTL